MIASAHIAAGFVAGMVGAYMTEKRLPRIATAFGLGLLSHVALDVIPHGDYWRFVPLHVAAGATPRGEYWSMTPSTVSLVVLCEVVTVCTIAGLILRHRLTPRWPEYLAAGLVGATVLDAKFGARILLPTAAAKSVERYGDLIHSHFHANPLSRPLLGTVGEIVTTLLLLAILTRFPRTDST